MRYHDLIAPRSDWRHEVRSEPVIFYIVVVNDNHTKSQVRVCP